MPEKISYRRARRAHASFVRFLGKHSSTIFGRTGLARSVRFPGLRRQTTRRALISQESSSLKSAQHLLPSSHTLRMTNPKPVTRPSLLDSIHYFSEMATTLKYVTSYLHARVTHFQPPIYHEEVKKLSRAKTLYGRGVFLI